MIKFLLFLTLGVRASSSASCAPSTNVQIETQWILDRILPTGVMVMNGRSGWVVPYNANMALWNILRVDPSEAVAERVFTWINWYTKHLNWPDKHGVYGTIYDYDVGVDGVNEQSKNTYDSSDSYGSTFLSLVSRWAKTNWQKNRDWVRDANNLYVLNAIGDAVWATFRPELGLTHAKPDYPAAFLMDNVEVWRGMFDFSELMFDISDYQRGMIYAERADIIRNGIETQLWDPIRREYRSHAGQTTPTNWTNYYPDVMANLFPQIFRLPEGLETSRRQRIYNLFKEFDRGRWTSIRKPDFADGLPSEAARLNGDDPFIREWMRNVERGWLPGREWTYFIGDASWLTLRLLDTQC